MAPQPPPPPASRTGSILRALTHTQNASALVFGTFMALHLAAPVAAAVGGLQAADGMMVLGREVYLPLEPVLVYLPLAVHVSASLVRRAILVYKTGRAQLSTHAKVGHALVPLVLPHLMLHRLIPASPEVGALSPSEFGFEFVGFATSKPWMVAGYLALTAAGVFHAAVGSMKVANWAKRLVGRKCDGHAGEVKAAEKAAGSKIPRRRRIGLRGIVGAFVGVVALGLFRLSDDGGISAAMVRRYDAVFAAAPWSSILR